MSSWKVIVVSLIGLLGCSFSSWAQIKKPVVQQPDLIQENDTVRYQKLPYDTVSTYEKGEEVNIESGTERLEVFGDTLRKLIGRGIVFRQGDATLVCDSAYHYPLKNMIEAYGDVRMVDDSLNLRARKIIYDGNTRLAKARGDVHLTNPKMNLTTQSLDYSLNSKIGYYFGGGKVVDNQNTLTSNSGSYDTQAKYFFFKGDVKLNSYKQGDRYDVTSDTLQYSEYTKIAYLQGDSKIKSAKGTTYSQSGTFNTITQISQLRGNSKVENDEYILTGNSVYYDEVKVYGYAQGNAQIFLKEDSVYVNGEEGKFWGQQGLTKFWGKPYVRQISQGDTLFLVADSIVSFNKKIQSSEKPKRVVEKDTADKRMMLAYNRVKIFRTDLQGIADSLAYDFRDSTIRMFFDPVLWNGGNQILGDSIKLITSGNELKKMEVRANSFMISQDTLKNFNQIKSRNVDFYLRNNQIKIMRAIGNAECIFYQIENDTSMTGMYRALCSSINAYFEDNELNQITFINKVDGKLIPPHILQEGDQKLQGFAWRDKERPDRQSVFVRDAKPKSRPEVEEPLPQEPVVKKEVEEQKEKGRKKLGKDNKKEKLSLQ